MMTERKLAASAKRVLKRLRERQIKIVLAESCTGGLVSAILTRIPGISEFHCGSAVVYQIETKTTWLRVSPSLLERCGPVSPETAAAMARGVLQVTSHAGLAASVTGYLGPTSPKGRDGLVYVAIACRKRGKSISVHVEKRELSKERGDAIRDPARKRLRRQRSATAHVLNAILAALNERDELSPRFIGTPSHPS